MSWSSGLPFGISTLHLGAAVRDNGVGRVITTEMEPGKAEQAQKHFEEAGLADVIEIRRGDALQTLRSLSEPISVLFLDGWKKLYLPVLQLLEPRLEPGAIVVGDDLQVMPEMLRPYLEHVREPRHGYVSTELPIGDGMELSVVSALKPGLRSV